jgi:hypothetical protein
VKTADCLDVVPCGLVKLTDVPEGDRPYMEAASTIKPQDSQPYTSCRQNLKSQRNDY